MTESSNRDWSKAAPVLRPGGMDTDGAAADEVPCCIPTCGGGCEGTRHRHMERARTNRPFFGSLGHSLPPLPLRSLAR